MIKIGMNYVNFRLQQTQGSIDSLVTVVNLKIMLQLHGIRYLEYADADL